jgi:HPt (histidine-containing phosphotransfer) domain-containing protein
MLSARNAIARGDPINLAYAVHTLCGMFGAMGADAARAVGERLESLAEAGEGAEITAAFAQLEREVAALRAELVGFALAAAA